MVAALRGHGLGVVADVVPNHMAIPQPESLNRQLWSVLAGGPGSRFAHWFDVDWAAGDGRFLLPILAGPVTSCLPDLRLDPAGDPAAQHRRAGAALLRPPAAGAGRHRAPAAGWPAGRAALPAGPLAGAAAGLNWRRFFDVTSLIAVRVEDPRVFSATHGLLLALAAEGLIDGLRVDHPDGLADPRGYLQRLAEASGGRWVVAEKILSAGRRHCHRTGHVRARPVTTPWPRPTRCSSTRPGRPADPCLPAASPAAPAGFAPVAHAARREVAGTLLAAEVSRLARLAARVKRPRAGPASSGHDLRTVLAELLAGFRRVPGLPGAR